MTGFVAYRGCIVVVTICTHDAGPRPLLGAPGRSLRQPSAIQDATSAPIASLLQDGHAEPAYAERKVLDRRDAMRGRSRAQSSAC